MDWAQSSYAWKTKWGLPYAEGLQEWLMTKANYAVFKSFLYRCHFTSSGDCMDQAIQSTTGSDTHDLAFTAA